MPTKLTTPAITADEARKLAAEYRAQTSQVPRYLDWLHGLIHRVANQGETSIEDPFADYLRPPPTQGDMEAIAIVLVGEGYGVAWLERLPPTLVISWED